MHPDTGLIINPIVRFSAFVPVNLIIAPYLLAPATIASGWLTAAGHWFNQSYNAGVNFANRNASSEVPDETLVKAYVGAVAASVSIGLGATALSKQVIRHSQEVLHSLHRVQQSLGRLFVLVFLSASYSVFSCRLASCAIPLF